MPGDATRGAPVVTPPDLPAEAAKALRAALAELAEDPPVFVTRPTVEAAELSVTAARLRRLLAIGAAVEDATVVDGEVRIGGVYAYRADEMLERLRSIGDDA